MNGAVVIFLDSLDKVGIVVERGIALRNTFVQVFPLVNPAKRIIVSNIPPFISDTVLERELSRHGKIVSAMKMLPSGCKSPKLKHVVSFRRQVFMVLTNDEDELNVAMKFKVDGFDYTIFATTETMKCFGCGQEGHLVRNCPDKVPQPVPSAQSAQDAQGAQSEGQADSGSQADSGGQADSGSQVGQREITAGEPGTNARQERERATTSAAVDSELSQISVGEGQEGMYIDELADDGEKSVLDDGNIFKVPSSKRKTRRDSRAVKSKKGRKEK
ncbi:Transposon TX1 uncharacterized 82 kDa protein [Nibea albiflora]|uniref:Transposon TX1 uncharacterized 82 kDa protein n=1 Tax=Nibea albiflora TaxID=240163 RepID=A0ACB7EKI5_NIBAL|nr:Transposon TX1 uncharacterized 82 kDa protein [Nibea albiflora]